MTDTALPLRITSPGDLVSLVPYLCGFVPHESLLVVWIERGRVVLTSRMDIDMLKSPLQRQLRQQCGCVPAADAVVVVWTTRRARGERVARWAEAALGRARVLDVVNCDGASWWSQDCTDPACCPPGGTPVDFESEAVVLAVTAGMARAGSREEAVAAVAGPTTSELPLLRGLLERACERTEHLVRDEMAAQLQELVTELAASGELPDEEGCLELAVLASHGVGAATAAAAVCTGGDDVDGHVALWSRVVRLAPPEVAWGPLAALGIVAWVAGRGAVATECCRRLEELAPEHVALQLLRAATVGALPPSEWGRLRPVLLGIADGID